MSDNGQSHLQKTNNCQPKIFGQVQRLLEANQIQAAPVAPEPTDQDGPAKKIKLEDTLKVDLIKTAAAATQEKPKRMTASQEVVVMLSDVAIDYMATIIKDTVDFYNHRTDNGKAQPTAGGAQSVKQINEDDAKMAIMSQTYYHFVKPPPREFLMEIASQKNKIPLAESLGHYLHRSVLDPNIFKGFKITDDGVVSNLNAASAGPNAVDLGLGQQPMTVKQLQKQLINDTVKSNKHDYLLPLERFCQLNPNYQLKDFEQAVSVQENQFADTKRPTKSRPSKQLDQ